MPELLTDIYNRERPSIPDEVLPIVQSTPKSEEKFSTLPLDALVNQEIADMVTSRRRSVITYRQEKKIIWDKCWDHYKQIYDSTGKESWQSTVFQPDTSKVVEVITSNLYSALMGPDMPIEWQCKIKEFEQQVKDANDLVRNDFEKSDFKTHFTDFLRGLAIVGTSVGKVGYAFKEDIVMTKKRQKTGIMERALSIVMNQPLEQKPDVYEPERIVVEDWAQAEYRDLYKIFPEPDTEDFGRDHWVIEESKITNRELMEGVEHTDEFFKLCNVTPDLLMSGGETEIDTETQARRWALQQQATSIQYFDPDRSHELLEYWGPVPLWMIKPEARNDEKVKYNMVNAWIWVIDGKYVVRATLNPYRNGKPPYFKGNYIRVPGDFYGIGAAELMLGLQINKNELVNTKTDNINLILNKIIAVIKDKIPSGCWERLVSAPGAIWLFENVSRASDAVAPIEFPNLISDIYLAIEEVNRAIEEVTAAVKATVGVGGSASEVGGGTFRGQLLNRTMASERFMVYARTIERCGLCDAYEMMYQRIYQYKSYDAVTSILGEIRGNKFEFLLPEKIVQVASLVPLGVMTMETKGVKLAQMSEFAKLWASEPWFKKYDMARRMWIEMGHSDPDSVIFSEEEMKEFNEFRKMMFSQPGMGGMGMGRGKRMPAPSPIPPGPVAGGEGIGPEIPPLPPAPMGPGASPIDMTGRPLS